MNRNRQRKIRTRFWLDSRIQARFVLFFVIACAIVSLLLVCFLYGYVWRTLSESFSLSSDVSPKALFKDVFVQALAATGIIFVICATFGAVLLVFVSHRIAGPIYRINKVLDNKHEGEPSSLRAGDALKDVYEKIYALAARNVEAEKQYSELLGIVEKLCEETSSKLPAEAPDMPSLERVKRFLTGELGGG